VVAAHIARRVSDPEVLAEAVRAAARQSRFARLLPWRPGGLGQGHAGIAVLCATMDRNHPGEGWDALGHRHLRVAAEAVRPDDPSLFSGLSGVGFAATQLAAGRPRYQRLLTGLDTALQPLVDAAIARLEGCAGCSVTQFDLISGLAGTGVYLLGRPTGPLVQRLLRSLAGLLADSGEPRRWHTPPELATGPLRASFPAGLHNCGLAHGVPGPLALLSLAMLDGIAVPRGEDAIRTAAAWLAAHRTGSIDAPDWPDGVGLDEATSRTEPAVGHAVAPPPEGVDPGRAAWCYGAPGVARSLWLAGTAVGEPAWCVLAARAIRAIAARPPTSWELATPTFCHGFAGLLQVLRRFDGDLRDATVHAAADSLASQLAGVFEPGSLLGVRGVEPEGVLVDQPGLLDGAPGVALALLGAPTAIDGAGESRAAWDRMFLLA
jgi:hypothetical protein